MLIDYLHVASAARLSAWQDGADAAILDLNGGYLMPGLWDVHIHPDYLSLDGIRSPIR